MSYSMLQFGARINSIEASRQKLCFSMAFYVYNKTYSKEIPKALVPVQPSSAEEHPGTAM